MTDPIADNVPRLDTPLLTPAEVARLLAVKPSWIHEAVRAGTLPCLRIGRDIRSTQRIRSPAAAFAPLPLDRINVEAVDRYARSRATEGNLSNASVNKTLAVPSRVMGQAVEYGHVASNPAAGKRRRLRPTKPERLWIEPPQVLALLYAAGELDAEDRSRRRYRRPLLATLAFAGLRVGELLALRWADVNLASGQIRVRPSKADAGVRTVDVQPELRDELAAWKASTWHAEPGDLVFPTSTGRGRTTETACVGGCCCAPSSGRTNGSPRTAAASRWPTVFPPRAAPVLRVMARCGGVRIRPTSWRSSVTLIRR
jgi:excisionase family DNA binding protein